MTREQRKPFVSIALVFIIVNGIIMFAKRFLEDNGFDLDFLVAANLLLLLVSVGSMLIQLKSLRSPNPQAFVRGVYGSFILKLFVIMVAVLMYAFLFRSKLNKPGLFTAMGLYIVYTVVEVSALMKVARKKKNA